MTWVGRRKGPPTERLELRLLPETVRGLHVYAAEAGHPYLNKAVDEIVGLRQHRDALVGDLRQTVSQRDAEIRTLQEIVREQQRVMDRQAAENAAWVQRKKMARKGAQRIPPEAMQRLRLEAIREVARGLTCPCGEAHVTAEDLLLGMAMAAECRARRARELEATPA